MPEPGAPIVRRRPPFPWFGRDQLWLLLSFIAVIVGSMLPWWQTALGTQSGLGRLGVLTIWAASIGLLGVLSVKQRWYLVLPIAGGLIAFGLILYELIRGSSWCSVEGGSFCRPGAGLVITGGAALYALLRGARVVLLQRAGSS